MCFQSSELSNRYGRRGPIVDLGYQQDCSEAEHPDQHERDCNDHCAWPRGTIARQLVGHRDRHHSCQPARPGAFSGFGRRLCGSGGLSSFRQRRTKPPRCQGTPSTASHLGLISIGPSTPGLASYRYFCFGISSADLDCLRNSRQRLGAVVAAGADLFGAAKAARVASE